MHSLLDSLYSLAHFVSHVLQGQCDPISLAFSVAQSDTDDSPLGEIENAPSTVYKIPHSQPPLNLNALTTSDQPPIITAEGEANSTAGLIYHVKRSSRCSLGSASSCVIRGNLLTPMASPLRSLGAFEGAASWANGGIFSVHKLSRTTTLFKDQLNGQPGPGESYLIAALRAVAASGPPKTVLRRVGDKICLTASMRASSSISTHSIGNVSLPSSRTLSSVSLSPPSLSSRGEHSGFPLRLSHALLSHGPHSRKSKETSKEVQRTSRSSLPSRLSRVSDRISLPWNQVDFQQPEPNKSEQQMFISDKMMTLLKGEQQSAVDKRCKSTGMDVLEMPALNFHNVDDGHSLKLWLKSDLKRSASFDDIPSLTHCALPTFPIADALQRGII